MTRTMAIRIDENKIQLPSPHKEKQKNRPGSLSGFLSRDIRLGNPFSWQAKNDFYAILSTLTQAGLNLKEALSLAGHGRPNHATDKVIETIKTNLIAGEPFSLALKKSGYFSEYEITSVLIGEETGTLGLVLGNLAEFFEKRITLRRNILNALSYPLIVSITAIGAVIFMLNFVVPLFKDVFLQTGGSLPWITTLVINLSETISRHLWTATAFFICIFSGLYMLRRNAVFCRLSASLILKTPVVGQIVLQSNLLQFYTAFHLLCHCGVPIQRILCLTKRMMKFYPLHQALLKMEADIIQGMSLSQAMSAQPVFSRRVTALVGVAESTGRLAYIFGHLVKQTEEELSSKTKTLSSVIEPVIIIVLGFFVAVILISMYLPMFRIGSSLGV